MSALPNGASSYSEERRAVAGSESLLSVVVVVVGDVLFISAAFVSSSKRTLLKVAAVDVELLIFASWVPASAPAPLHVVVDRPSAALIEASG